MIKVSRQDDIVIIQLSDPARRNTLSDRMLIELSLAFETMPASIRVVVLRSGHSDPVWCSGFDIRALEAGRDPLERHGSLQTLFRHIADCPAPVIGMVHGSTWGGGADLAFRCDLLVGDTTAQFAFTPAKLGLPYDSEGLLNVLLRVGSAVALEMFATAEPIKAERALAVGILNHLVPDAELESITMEMATKIASNAPLSVKSAKLHLRAIIHALPLTMATAQSLSELRDRALRSQDFSEGLAAFAEKRQPKFSGR